MQGSRLQRKPTAATAGLPAVLHTPAALQASAADPSPALLDPLALLHAAEAMYCGEVQVLLSRQLLVYWTPRNLLPGGFIPLWIQAVRDPLEGLISTLWLARVVQASHSSRSAGTAAATTMSLISRWYECLAFKPEQWMHSGSISHRSPVCLECTA
jgi:hypothetical protein